MRSIKSICRSIFSVRRHWIMKLNMDSVQTPDSKAMVLLQVSDNKDLIDGTYSRELQRKLIMKNQGFCDTFILKNKDNYDIGIFSVMYRHGNELEYKIRNIDAFIYNVYVKPEYRGHGYAGLMIKLAKSVFIKKGIKEVFLAVSTDNISAINSYKKTGFVNVGKKTFIRFLKVNIPYYSL